MSRQSVFDAPLALGLPSKDKDVLTAKRLFNQLGRLTEPSRGFSNRFDQSLDTTVREFQRDKGILEDGRIDPGGATERNIRRDRGELPKEPPLDPVELDFSAPVGNGLENRPEDIIGVSKLLGRMGLLKFDKTKEPSSTISTRLVESLKELQRENGLTPTGEFKPGDKTDAILKAEAEKIVGSDPMASQSRDPRDPGKLRQVAQLESDTDGPQKVKPIVDDIPKKFQDIEWVSTGVMLTKGTQELKTKGPIRVDASTASFLGDKKLYRVEWQPLDEFGRVMPVVSNRDKKLKERMAVAGNVGVIGGSKHIWEPPFDWPHGFRVKISIPPQAPTRRGSLGILLQIRTSEGGLIK